MSTEIVNGIVETAQRFPPDLLAFYGALAFGMAFSAKQREWILARDNHECQGHTVMMSHRCLHDQELQVHHIEPQLYMYEHGAQEDEVDTPENAITLCSVAHVDSRGDNPNAIHNDQYAVKCEYREGNKNAFRDMQFPRLEKVRQGLKYWNDRFDGGFKAYARDTTRKFIPKKGPFPTRNRKG